MFPKDWFIGLLIGLAIACLFALVSDSFARGGGKPSQGRVSPPLVRATPAPFGSGTPEPYPRTFTTPTPTPGASPAASPTPTPLPWGNGLAPIRLVPRTGYSTANEAAVIRSLEGVVNRTVQSQCFGDFLKNSKMNMTNGRSPAQVAAHLQGLVGTIEIEMYNAPGSSAMASAWLGGLIVGSKRVHRVKMNRKFFGLATPLCRWAATAGGHEGLGHSLGGYGHGAKWSVSRERTVPYTIEGAKKQYGWSAFPACCVE